MFVRRKKNKSGSVSVQIIDKSQGYRVLATLGAAHDPDEIARLLAKGKQLLAENFGTQQKLLPVLTSEDYAIENFLDTLTNAHIRTVGPELIFGALFDRMGFGAIKTALFRHIVIARLAYPASKLKTVDYLYRYKGISVSVQSVYRFLDQLKSSSKATVERIAYAHTKRLLGDTISLVFYDVTTLYFEAEDEDDLRKIGFSKDGKFQHPQILLGLLVGAHGYPISYDIFEGNTFEGHTLLTVLERAQEKYHIGKPIVVADAALLSTDNLEKLAAEDYRFILGARIKNEGEEIKTNILKQAQGIADGAGFAIEKPDDTRLIVTYSAKRARKDARNRERGLRKLRARVKSGKLTKEHLTKRGYNKFLKLEGEVAIAVDEAVAAADAQWDGLKGYVTNTDLPIRTVVEHYGHLWQIEKAFRISKTDLRIRPIFHYRRRRIEAHICIAFVAYAIYKELERLLVEHGVVMSARRAAELTHTMYALEYRLPNATNIKIKMLKMDAEQQMLYEAVYA